MTPPLVSLITLNYNQAALTAELLVSVAKLTYPHVEVIVVDNHSAEDPTPVITAQFPGVQLVVTDQNLGFSGGNNRGIERATGDYLLFLNNDTEVTPDLIERLLEPFDDPDVGVVCPKIRYYQQPDVIQYAGYSSLNPFTGQARAIGSHQPDRGQFDQPGPTPFAHGAAMLVKRAVIDQAGLMPELYFLYYEELDWCCRIRQAGYQIFYQPTALVYHKESMTVGKGNPMKVYYQTRNRLLFMRRNAAAFPLAVFLAYYAGVALPKALITYGWRRQFPFLRATLRAVGWNLRHTVVRVISPPTSSLLSRVGSVQKLGAGRAHPVN